MSKLLCNVLKISGGGMPQMLPPLVARLGYAAGYKPVQAVLK